MNPRTTILAAVIIAAGLALGLPAIATGHPVGSTEWLTLERRLTTIELNATSAATTITAQDAAIDTLRGRIRFLEDDVRVNQLVEWSGTVGARIDAAEATATAAAAAATAAETAAAWPDICTTAERHSSRTTYLITGPDGQRLETQAWNSEWHCTDKPPVRLYVTTTVLADCHHNWLDPTTYDPAEWTGVDEYLAEVAGRVSFVCHDADRGVAWHILNDVWRPVYSGGLPRPVG